MECEIEVESSTQGLAWVVLCGWTGSTVQQPRPFARLWASQGFAPVLINEPFENSFPLGPRRSPARLLAARWDAAGQPPIHYFHVLSKGGALVLLDVLAAFPRVAPRGIVFDSGPGSAPQALGVEFVRKVLQIDVSCAV